jgi:uncharacterized metal-binding protein YceD (DUF177 family)
MILELSVKGTVDLLCDRCLDFYSQKVNSKSKLFVKFGHQEEDDGDEIIINFYDDYQINVAQYLYELVILGLPIKRVHPMDETGQSTCDPEMLKKLDEYLVEESQEEDDEPVDERWNELKKLLDNK